MSPSDWLSRVSQRSTTLASRASTPMNFSPLRNELRLPNSASGRTGLLQLRKLRQVPKVFLRILPYDFFKKLKPKARPSPALSTRKKSSLQKSRPTYASTAKWSRSRKGFQNSLTKCALTLRKLLPQLVLTKVFYIVCTHFADASDF